MPFSQNITYNDAQALMPEEVSDVLLERIAETNPVLQLSRRLPNMARGQLRMPVMSALATAYFVEGHTGLKKTTKLEWENKFIDAAEIAAIVPIPEVVLADSGYDIWGQVQPELVTAFNVALTNAVLYGDNIPASWTTNLGSAGLVAGAGAVTTPHIASIAGFPDIYDAIFSESAAGAADGLYMLVENDGYNVTGNVAHVSMRGRLRGMRDLQGQPIFMRTPQEATQYALDSAPVFFPTDGTIDSAQSLMIAGQWDQLVWAMRQDITFKILEEAVIQDPAGNIIFNLAQQDMVALRAVMRIGVALPNPINRMEEDEDERYPFAVLTA